MLYIYTIEFNRKPPKSKLDIKHTYRNPKQRETRGTVQVTIIRIEGNKASEKEALSMPRLLSDN